MIILDTYCKAGGAGEGYANAGFTVVGVDIQPQKNYPYEFHQSDAVEFINKYGKDFDAIHASPPCQLFTRSTAYLRNEGKMYPDLIEPTRLAIYQTGRPGIMENVPQAPVRPDLILRGDLFGLKVIRKRHFELINFFMMNPCFPKLKGSVVNGDYVSIYGKGAWKKSGSGKGRRATVPIWRKKTIRETWQYAMGINHFMTDVELSESIPPAYTEYIGKYLIEYLCQNKKPLSKTKQSINC